MAKEFKRLSTSVRPSNYNVTFHPNLETFKFTGSETVDIEVYCIIFFSNFKG